MDDMNDASMVTTDANQRKHERLRLDTKVRYRVINRQVVEALVDPKAIQDDGQTVNISASGIALYTAANLNKGDFLKLELSLPGMTRPTRALAEVMWAEPKAGQCFSGIRFVMILNEADDGSVRRFIETSTSAPGA